METLREEVKIKLNPISPPYYMLSHGGAALSPSLC